MAGFFFGAARDIAHNVSRETLPMTDPLRQPVFSHQPIRARSQVQAALDGETLQLCQTGELRRIYEVWPDFTQRSQNLHKVILERLLNSMLTKGGAEVNLACHCHEDIVSIALQVNRDLARPEPAAEKTIPVRLFWG